MHGAKENEGDMSYNLVLGDRKVVKCTTSCPPGWVDAGTSGPWSLEWIHRQNNEVIMLKNKSHSSGAQRVIEKKGGGVIRHNAQSIK